ncbi:uncharacterized protein BX664DRAFT_338254 [Halteromyces radiatus]|uniref:uncharacterized protein n=1 Tax=Halteromyces radiatus TaxID=101107 RepID=UPI0022210D88|nr:uncharacterized protein BX664DRAFT_338254 [Halteromyces radiatus]KAI8084981.1 hypothetical protein BX664DRAFT_338254 [Halteromyces radiatus]
MFDLFKRVYDFFVPSDEAEVEEAIAANTTIETTTTATNKDKPHVKKTSSRPSKESDLKFFQSSHFPPASTTSSKENNFIDTKDTKKTRSRKTKFIEYQNSRAKTNGKQPAGQDDGKTTGQKRRKRQHDEEELVIELQETEGKTLLDDNIKQPAKRTKKRGMKNESTKNPVIQEKQAKKEQLKVDNDSNKSKAGTKKVVASDSDTQSKKQRLSHQERATVQRVSRSRTIKLGNHQCMDCAETFDTLEQMDDHRTKEHPHSKW